MGWREEVLFDHQFFGPPNGMSEAQKKMVEYAAGVIGGTMFALNCLYHLKVAISDNAPEIAEKLGLTEKKGSLHDRGKTTSSGIDARGTAF